MNLALSRELAQLSHRAGPADQERLIAIAAQWPDAPGIAGLPAGPRHYCARLAAAGPALGGRRAAP